TAADEEEHVAAPHTGADRLFDDGDAILRVPVRLATADAEQEIREDLAAAGGVDHLRMELQAVETTHRFRDRGHRAGAGPPENGEPRRHRRHGVAMTHPDLLACG